MEVKIIEAIRDDYSECGPSLTNHVFLSLDGFLFDLGKFYTGPFMNEGTQERLAKVLEFKRLVEEGKWKQD